MQPISSCASPMAVHRIASAACTPPRHSIALESPYHQPVDGANMCLSHHEMTGSNIDAATHRPESPLVVM